MKFGDWVGQAARLLILQADAFAGFHTLYEGERVLDAACLSRVRRKMWDINGRQHRTPGRLAHEALV
jgi:transposase